MFIAKHSRGNDDPTGIGEVDDDAAVAWEAPVPDGALDATVPLPGSKSLTGRELILSALADGPGVLRAPLRSRDAELMTEALRSLGTGITAEPRGDGRDDDLRIVPATELSGSTTVDCGLAGTVMRFVPPVAALALGPTAFDGDPYARKRPMRPVLDALRALGADIADDGRGALPFTVHGTGSLRGGRVELDASLSSQFVSGLLLSAARFDEGVHVVHTGDRLPSVPHIEMTLDVLRARGVEADSPVPGEWRVAPGPIAAREVEIEPDLSNAAPFLAAALAVGGRVTVPGWPASTTQVGDQLRELLPAFGGEVSPDGDRLTVSGDGVLRGVELHVPEAGELAPTLVGLAALAALPRPDGTPGESSTITGIGHIRHHETDRIAALVAEIRGLGGDADELEDGIVVRPAALHAGLWHAYADHRMATTGALIGLLVPGVQVDDIGSTSKTLPQFTRLWDRMLGSGTSDEKLDGADIAGNGMTAAADILSGLLGGFGRA
ncbi:MULTISPECIES: 3-phosphoshikimate 1-carboxyvinyltransferase [unclassified Leucobacter]|uniref:3-phosphoshikimate 1-carboxyvinyltransferase n=1 Tax=unclassified Leucobacter TaxID=2621730 RepID=UPI0006228528|nr:3-phosphoshikimate 1-carboxyvinyltransferase [Leucobacter sp. Ag1]KKI20425.1 3-phosphoshikimate 1-carboxyvinyltransferase [Leucobacter sp. Ag1]